MENLTSNCSSVTSRIDMKLCQSSILPCGLALLFYAPIVTLFMVSITCLYPVFIHVSKQNYDRDKTTSIYHITRHFHTVVKFMQKMFYVIILNLFLILLMFNIVNKIIQGIIAMLVPLLYWLVLTVTMIEHILLSILAIQRCFIFFFEKHCRYFTLSDKIWSRLIKFLYLYLFIFNTILRIVKILVFARTVSFSAKFLRFLKEFDLWSMRFYFLINILMIISAMFYIPILMRIKKLKQLQSVQKIQPERYVIYQTAVLLVFKLLYIPLILLIGASLGELNEHTVFSGMLSIDIFTTHFIIQTSYLICNRNNMATTLVKCGFSRYAEVAPTTSIYHITRHFYYVVQFMQISFFLGILIVCFVILFYYDVINILQKAVAVSIPIFYIIVLTVTMIEHILLSVLAIQRCFIFFFDWSSRYVTVSNKSWSRLIKLLYLTIFLFNFLLRLLKFTVLPPGTPYKEEYDTFLVTYDVVNMRFYFGINILMGISAMLYIPMLLRIKKLSKLQCVRKNQPDKYVMFKTTILLVFKLLYIPSVLLLGSALEKMNEDVIFFGMISIDIFTTHFIIQTSYLICSRHNLSSTLVCCGFSRYAEVEPAEYERTTKT